MDNFELLSKEGVAKSPFENFPGTVEMPEYWTVTTYNEWWTWFTKITIEKQQEGLDVNRFFGSAVIERDAQIRAEIYKPHFYELVEKWGKVSIPKLEGIKGDELPVDVFVWLCDIGEEWQERHSSFRRFNRTNDPAPNSNKPNKKSSGG